MKKNNNITVKKAIRRGQLMVNIPVFIIMFGSIVLTVILVGTKTFPDYFTFIGLISSFGLGWLWWSFTIVHWRIWAFSNVRNVHELKHKAIQGRLIWPDKSKYNKTEIRTKSQQRKLKDLQVKFNFSDIIEIVEDDGSLPSERKIFHSKLEQYSSIFISLMMCGFAIQLLLNGNFIYTFILLIGCYFLVQDALPKLKSKSPVLTLNNQGIDTSKTRFIPWENVVSTQNNMEGSGKRTEWFLEIEYYPKNGKYKTSRLISINGLNASPSKIEDMIRIYQQRNRQQATNS